MKLKHDYKKNKIRSQEIRNRIYIEVRNEFSKKMAFEISMPYIPALSIDGYYSKMWRRLKNIVYSETMGRKATNIFFKNEFSQNTVMAFESGAILIFPFDATEYDMEIIKAQLNVLRMSLAQ